MNLELIKKLVKLANNNPNENEANLAARKVCRMIEEGKFEFVESPTYIYDESRIFRGDEFNDLADFLKRYAAKSESKAKTVSNTATCKVCSLNFTRARPYTLLEVADYICFACEQKMNATKSRMETPSND